MQDQKNPPAKSQINDEKQDYGDKTSSDIAIETAAKKLTRRQIIRDASEFVKKLTISSIHLYFTSSILAGKI